MNNENRPTHPHLEGLIPGLPPLPFSPFLFTCWTSPEAKTTQTLYTAEQMREYAQAALAALPGGGVDDEPDAWWNGIRPSFDGMSVPSIRWDGENSGHDIPMFAGFNPQGPIVRMLNEYKARAEKAEAALAALPGGGVDEETEWVVTSANAGTAGHPRFATEAAAFAHFAENSQIPSYINPSRMRQAQVYRVRTETTDVTASAIAALPAPPPHEADRNG